MQPYVIRQGDHVALLAYKFGFDANTVWNDPANASLRALRPDPNILWPTDILYIPDQNVPPVMKALAQGTTNTFVSDAPTVAVSITFSDASFASQAYSVQELPALTGLTTDASGVMTFPVPVSLATATIVFTDVGATFAYNIGDLDPIDTLSGIFQRLQHLGFIDPDATVDASDLDPIRAALRAFNATGDGPAAADPSPAATSTPASTSPSEPSPPSDGGPPPSSPPASGPPPSDSSAPLSSAPAPQGDNGGLSDDGSLDPAISARLLAAHGS